MFSYILFDLDGTISDPKIGITTCVQYALKSFGIEEPDLKKLEPFIGPPLRDSFMEFYGFTKEQAELATAKYRERFSAVGKYENTLYPGMAELLRDLQAAGAHLAIASSKPTVFVEDILQYFHIRQYFDIVVGSELDGTRDKKEEVVAEVLGQFAQEGAADASSVVMIGDRKFDIEGAKAVGAHHIGVAYGYALPGELQEAGAEIVVQDVAGLRRVLLGYQPQTAVRPREEERAAVKEKGPQSIFYGKPAHGYNEQRQNDGFYGNGQNGMYDRAGDAERPGYYGRNGVYSGNASYRQQKSGTKAGKVWKAVLICLMAMGLYYIVNFMVGSIVLIIGIMIGNASSSNFWLNLGSAAGMITGFASCYGIWHQQIAVRPTKRADALSLIPMAVLSAASAVAMNGLLALMELYKISPRFQEISEMQFDTPVWLGILSFGILAPLGEEVVFRGIVYGQLKKVCSVPAAIILSGLLFGIFHGNLVQGVYATVIGILLALVYELYGSILASMAFHGIANLFVYIMLDLTEFGGIFLTPPSCVFFFAISIVSLVLMVKWQKGSGQMSG